MRLLYENRIWETQRCKELDQEGLGVDLRLSQNTVLKGGFENLLLRGLAGQRFKIGHALSEDACLASIDVRLLIIQRGDENFGGGQGDVQDAALKAHIFGLELAHIDSSNHDAVRDEEQFVTEEETKGSLPLLGGDYFLHAILDGLKTGQRADLGDVSHRVGDDRRRWMHQLGDLSLHGLIGLLQRLKRGRRLLGGLADRGSDGVYNEVHARDQDENDDEVEPVIFHSQDYIPQIICMKGIQKVDKQYSYSFRGNLLSLRKMRLTKLITIYCLLVTAFTACAPTSTPPPTQTPTFTAETSTPAPELGTLANPLLLALPPAQVTDSTDIANGQALAALLETLTGYHIVAVAPTTSTELIEAMRTGRAHIAAFSPFALTRAYEQGAVRAAFVSTKDGDASYGAQFIGSATRFKSYYDPILGENVGEVTEALSQFAGARACWTESDSPSGYLVPAGMLGWYKVSIPDGAFVQSHFSVVRAVQQGICDFGATYIDARDYPALKDSYPQLKDDVLVIWQIPAIIPYDGIFLSSTLSDGMLANLRAALQQVIDSPDGATILTALWDGEGWSPVDDDFYVEFTRYLLAAPIDLDALIH